MQSDDRWQVDPDEANGSDPEKPYLDRAPRPGVRPALKQPDRRGRPTPEEIEAFIKAEFPETTREKKRLIRPPGWDEALARAAARGPSQPEPEPETTEPKEEPES